MKTRKISLLILLLIALTQLVQSQSKSYVVPLGVFYLDASSSPYNQVKGGDTLYFQAGNRDYICLKNFKGVAGNPIVITNLNGSVVINTTHYYGIAVQNCRYIKLTGTGFKGAQYGFDIQRVTSGAGIGVGYLSSDYEIDHISIQNTLLGALYAKTDPDLTTPSTREKFTQFNTIIHDNYIAYCGDEGMYIGSTKYDGQIVTNNGRDTLLLPSLLDGVQVYNNIIKYAGWDGIQVSSASKNCKIYNNTILFDSQSGTYAQMSGIMIGGGTKCDCYNNYIADGKGDGIDCMGLGGTRIFNNIIVNPGLTYFPGDFSYPKHGIFISDNSVQKDSTFYIFNNNIINPKSDGIRFSSTKSKGNLISSNVIINPGNFNYYETDNTSTVGNDSYVMVQLSGTDITLKNNYFDRTGTLAGFSSPAMHEITDLMPIAGSLLVDAADTNPKASVTFDFSNNPRPSGLGSDIGALEYKSAAILFSGGAIASSQSICPGSVPAAFTNLTAPSGYAGTLEYKWQVSIAGATSGFSDITNTNSVAYTSGALSTATWYRRLARVTTMTDWNSAAISNAICISINPLPAAAAGANRTINLGAITQIGAATVSGSTYSWASSPVGFTSAIANPTVNPVVNTTYSMTETSNAGCTKTSNVVISINALPAANAGSNRTICQNSSTQIGASAVSGNTYSWTSSPAGFTSSLSNPTVKPMVTTTYILVEIVTATGATKTNNVLVTVNSSPILPAIGGSNMVCAGKTILLTNQTTGGTWGSSMSSIATVSSSGTVKGASAGVASIIYSVTNTSGCNTSVSAIVTVNAAPATPGNFTVFSDKVKLGQSNIIYTVPYVSGVSYVWNWSGRGVTITGSTNSVKVSFSTRATSGTLSVKAVNSCGTSSERSMVVLSYKGGVLPGVGFAADSTVQMESNINLSTDLMSSKNELTIYPNPTRGSATFEFLINEDAKVTLDIFSLTGQRIAGIFDTTVEAGSRHTIPFNQILTPGVYPCILRWKGQMISTKLMVTR